MRKAGRHARADRGVNEKVGMSAGNAGAPEGVGARGDGRSGPFRQSLAAQKRARRALRQSHCESPGNGRRKYLKRLNPCPEMVWPRQRWTPKI